MTIPLVDLRKQYAPLKTEILEGIGRVLEGMNLFLGENVQALEKEFAQFCSTDYGIGLSDGTAALHAILRAMGIGPGDEVITVSHTFIATAEAILLTGARPVFVDVCPDTLLMDVSQVESKITARTKAVIPVHLYGQPVAMDPLLEIASRHNLRVIEDACQAHGAEYKGKRVGSIGDAGAFSFYYAKNLGGYGEGGFVTTNDPELAAKVRMIRDHGSKTRYHHDLIGFNGRLDEIQAVVLRTKLPRLEAWNSLRRKHAQRYSQALSGTPVVLPVERNDVRHVYHLFVIRTPFREQLQRHLKQEGIATGIHYPIPVHLQPPLTSPGAVSIRLPITEQIVGEILSLPMYAELTEDEIDFVAAVIRNFFATHDRRSHEKVADRRI